MKKYLPLLATITLANANEGTVIITAPKLEITDSYLQISESESKNELTLDQQLQYEPSYFITKDQHNANALSFRGIKSTATNVIEDLIPAYRTTGGNVDFYYNFNMYDIVSNMALHPSSLGV